MSIWGKIWDKVTDVAHHVTGIPTADEKRNAARAVNDQVKAYKDASEITRAETAAKRGEVVAQKRRVEEKQVRALRRNYRGAGFLGASSPQSNANDMSNQLGG